MAEIFIRNDFFENKKIKKLERVVGGKTFIIIYLKIASLGFYDFYDIYDLSTKIREDVLNIKNASYWFVKFGLAEIEFEKIKIIKIEQLEEVK